MIEAFDGHRIAEERIAEAARTGQDWLDLGGLGLTHLPEGLFRLTGLRRLNLGYEDLLTEDGWSRATSPPMRLGNNLLVDLARLAALTDLTNLSVAGSDCANLDFLSAMIGMTFLSVAATNVDSLAPIQGLVSLRYLDCRITQVNDLTPIQGLSALRHLDCSNTPVSNLKPIRDLVALQHLDCHSTQVSDLGPIQGLAALQHLACWRTQVSDLRPLQGLSALRYINCNGTQVSDLGPLRGLAALRYLACGGTQVSDLGSLRSLTTLQHLECGDTEVNDLRPLRGLTALQHLSCSHSRVSDLAPIANLDALQYLSCGGTQVQDLTPILDLAALQHLGCSSCHLNDVELSIWMKPSLRTLHLDETRIPDIPDQVLGRDCLDRLRAHLSDLEAGAERMRDVKLLILGNGGSGKTQIARRLSGLPFDPDWDSTHGIKVSQARLPVPDGQVETKLHLWDFGGQDIYHGTHALFVRSRSLFLVVWCEATEQPESQPDQHGMVFRNHPLPYWLDYVRHLGDRASPVVVAQAQVDRTGVRPAPDPAGLIAGIGAASVVTSAADPPRLGALTGALQDAVAELDRRRGAVSIGKGRVAVQRRIEALRLQDGSLPAEYRTISQETFRDWCQQAGGVSSPEHLLAYLHSVGTLFHQEGFFQDRIVLDHAWALDAIYAVFDRAGPYKRLTEHGGRFDRADLAMVWRDYSAAEQRLFLGMMRSCGICFVYREGARSDDTIYLAPDLLPEKTAIQARIDATWGDGAASHRQTFAYPFLHHGLIRGVIARLGELGRDVADYFRGGVCLFDSTTRSHALIQQEMAAGQWSGTVTIETKGGQAESLLDRIAALITRENEKLGLKPTTDRAAPLRDRTETVVITPGRPETDADAYAVSYAWNDAKPGGPDRESKVDALCEAAEKRGEHVLRDKTDMRPGDRIDKFTDRIGRAGRVFVFLSDKYLRSDYCMQELAVLWTQSGANQAALRDRVLFYFLGIDLSDGATRDTILEHWVTRVRSNEARRARMGPDELKIHTLMSRFLPDLYNVLYALGNSIRHQDFDTFLRDGFPKRGA